MLQHCILWSLQLLLFVTLDIVTSVGVVAGFIGELRRIDGVCEELTRANDWKIRDHLDSRILKNLRYIYEFYDKLMPTKNVSPYFEHLV